MFNVYFGKQTYSRGSQIASGECLVTVPRNFFRFIVMSTVVFHSILQIGKVLRGLDVVDVRSRKAQEMGVELLPFERMRDER
jgi:hypothetical protein